MAHIKQEDSDELVFSDLDRFTYPPPSGTDAWTQDSLYGPNPLTVCEACGKAFAASREFGCHQREARNLRCRRAKGALKAHPCQQIPST